MQGRPKKPPRQKNPTSRYLSGAMEDDLDETSQRFSNRSKTAQHDKMMKTTVRRQAVETVGGDIDALPVGDVAQVFSLFVEVEKDHESHRCVVRKTLNKTSATAVIVGDRVRFRLGEMVNETNRPEGVIEQILPRETILTRSDSFRSTRQHPIVANAHQMLIVASLLQPRVKWGLVDRMIIAALSGKLRPIVCLNKIDLANDYSSEEAQEALVEANAVLDHYEKMDVGTIRLSAHGENFDRLKALLRDRTTVLAGHSGVGKSSLIRAIQPNLDLRIGEVSKMTEKGIHTTTSARIYHLDFGASVVDTPGVKQFGLWTVTKQNLGDYFPDVSRGDAPEWRRASYERILKTLT